MPVCRWQLTVWIVADVGSNTVGVLLHHSSSMSAVSAVVSCLYHQYCTEPVEWRWLEVVPAVVVDQLDELARVAVSATVAVEPGVDFAPPKLASLVPPLRTVA